MEIGLSLAVSGTRSASAFVIDTMVFEGDSITSTTPDQAGSHNDFYSYHWKDNNGGGYTINVRAEASRGVVLSGSLNDNSNTLIGNVAEDAAYNPDLLHVMIGMNDMISKTAAQYRADLVTWATAFWAAAPGARIAYSPPTPMRVAATQNANYATYTGRRDTHMADVRDPAVWGQWANYYNPMGETPDLVSDSATTINDGPTDGIHPTAPATTTTTGQYKLRQGFEAFMASILDASRTNATTPDSSIWPASQTGLAVSTVITDRFIIKGIAHTGLALTGANSLAVTGTAQIRLNGGTYGSSVTGWLYNGDVIDAKITTSASNNTAVSYDLTIGTETRTITKTTVAAATPITYTAGVDILTSTASATTQTYTLVTFAAGIPAVVLTSHTNIGGANDSTPTAGNVTLTPSGGGDPITLVMRKRQDRALSRTLSFWSGSATIAAGDYTLTVTRPLAASHNAVQYWTIHDADPTPTATDGNVPAEPSNTNHSTPSITVNASGMAFAAFLIEDDTTPVDVTVSAGATEFQADVVAINTSGIGLAVAARSTTGAVEFNQNTGTYARLIVAFKALGT